MLVGFPSHSASNKMHIYVLRKQS